MKKKPSLFEEGEYIEVKQLGSTTWKTGKIRRDRGDTTYDIIYSTGEQENRIREDRLRHCRRDERVDDGPLEEGDDIEANYRGRGKYYHGKIKRNRGDNTYDIDYNDGEKELRVKRSYIRNLNPKNKVSRDSERKTKLSFYEGDRIEGNFKGRGKWYPGRICFVRSDGTFDIDYYDHEKGL